MQSDKHIPTLLFDESDVMNARKRVTHEDVHRAVPFPLKSKLNIEGLFFGAVYDGHGGRDVAEFVGWVTSLLVLVSFGDCVKPIFQWRIGGHQSSRRTLSQVA